MKLPQRRNPRLKGYDYSQAGYYFVTICTRDKQPLLSQIVGGGFHAAPELKLTRIGHEISLAIEHINNHYPSVSFNKHVIMPNHLHAVVGIQCSPSDKHESPPLHHIIGRLKSYTNKKYNELNGTEDAILWQRSFHDHIIRNERSYQHIWHYIETNPIKWVDDCYYTNE